MFGTSYYGDNKKIGPQSKKKLTILQYYRIVYYARKSFHIDEESLTEDKSSRLANIFCVKNVWTMYHQIKDI